MFYFNMNSYTGASRTCRIYQEDRRIQANHFANEQGKTASGKTTKSHNEGENTVL